VQIDDEMENPHVVGGNTEYLSTMRKFWVARLGE